jgi:AmmeMemoRadiSam system protein B
MFENDIREPVVAGSFYPDNSRTLSQMVIEFLNRVENVNLNNIIGLVSPHAGYIYSGQVAAYCFKQIEGKQYDSIIIIAPSHSEYFDFNSVFEGKAYETPLGVVEIDSNRIYRLTSETTYKDYIRLSNAGHRREHSLEVQLPFLQTILKDIKIVPIVMGSQNKKNIESLGNSIGKVFKGENILVVASTDLSHYHNYNTATTLDSKVIDFINTFDASALTEAIVSEKLEMCGGGPVATTMLASRLLGADKSKVLCYKNSGDVTGDKSAVVGYLSATFYKS